MSEIFPPNPEAKKPPQTLLHRDMLTAYDRYAEELVAHYAPIRIEYEEDFPGTPEGRDKFADNIRNRFIDIRACADPDYVKEKWALDDRYVHMALKEDKLSDLFPSTEAEHYSFNFPVAGVSQIDSNFRIENMSKPIYVGNRWSQFTHPAVKSGDFMGIQIRSAGQIRSLVSD